MRMLFETVEHVCTPLEADRMPDKNLVSMRKGTGLAENKDILSLAFADRNLAVMRQHNLLDWLVMMEKSRSLVNWLVDLEGRYLK
jgi:hypothetical protein